VYLAFLDVWLAGIENKRPNPAMRLSGACMPKSGFYRRQLGVGRVYQGEFTHPILGSSAPAMTAPSETPTVIAVFARPMYNPLRLALVIWIAMMLATMKMPPPPAPVIARPKTKCSNDTEVDVMINPTLINMVEENMHNRGLNTWLSLPIKGASDDMAMRYADVNQLAFSKASKSAAMDDCVVVRMEMLVADACQGFGLMFRSMAIKWRRIRCRLCPLECMLTRKERK